MHAFSISANAITPFLNIAIQLPSYLLNAKPVTRISSCRLGLPNNLHHLSASQAKVPRNRITKLNSRQLRILQSISLQQRSSLLLTEQHMCRNQLVMRDVNQQVLLNEALDSCLGRNRRDDLERSGSDVDVGDQDTGVKVIRRQVLSEGAHLLDTHAGVWKKLHPDGSDVWGGRIGVCGCDRIGISDNHGIRGASGELHLSAAG